MHAHTLAVLGVFLAGALHAAEPVVTKLMFKPSGPAPQEIVTVPAGTVLEVLSYRKGSGEDAFVRVAAEGNEVSVADPTGLVMKPSSSADISFLPVNKSPLCWVRSVLRNAFGSELKRHLSDLDFMEEKRAGGWRATGALWTNHPSLIFWLRM